MNSISSFLVSRIFSYFYFSAKLFRRQSLFYSFFLHEPKWECG